MLDAPWDGFHAFPVAAAGMTSIGALVERLMAAAGRRVAVEATVSARAGFTVSSAYAIERFGYRPMEIGAMLDRYAAEAMGELANRPPPGAPRSGDGAS